MCAYGRGAGGFTPAVGCPVAGAVRGGGGLWVHDAVEEGGFAGGDNAGGSVVAAGGERHVSLWRVLFGYSI